jgi:hypothetical protein
VGVYHHPAPAGSGFHSEPVKDTNLREGEAFVDAYLAKSLVFARKLFPPP